jgi:hypothetical protein
LLNVTKEIRILVWPSYRQVTVLRFRHQYTLEMIVGEYERRRTLGLEQMFLDENDDKDMIILGFVILRGFITWLAMMRSG